jgi:hypothetical protein
MKSRALFISLIGMMSMTAFATTSEPEQKQNPVFTDQPIELVYTVNVESNFDFVAVETPTIKQGVFTQVLLKSSILYEFVAIITDVGWQSRKAVYSNIPHKEKLHTDYVIDKKQILSYLGLINKRFSC